jgi:acetyl esterase/lipase
MSMNSLRQILVLSAGCAALLMAAPSVAQSNSPSAKPPPFTAPSPMRPKPAAPDMQAVLDALKQLGGKPIETLSPAQARMQPSPADAVKKVMAARHMPTAPDPSVTTTDMAYGPDAMQKARIYRPAGLSKSGKAPVVIYYHGGGWVIADLKTYDATPRLMAKELHAVVVSVEYRHAPEHRFPAQHDDANMAYDWAVKNAAAWGGDPMKLVVAGESAGGNLAVTVAMHARDTRMAAPKAVLAVYPIASSDQTLPSKTEAANAKPLNTPMLKWFAYYVQRTPADMMDPRWDLTKANLRGLPPVTIINADIDPLRDDGLALERALDAAGVSTERKVYPGVTHEFFGMGKVVRGARDAETYAVTQARKALGM